MTGPKRATLAGAGAIAIWSTLALLSREAAGVPPIELTALAFTISGSAGLVWLAMRGRLRVLRQPPLAWAHGVGGLAGYHALYFAALARAPAAVANLLNYAWPLLIVLLSAPILGMRLRAHHLAGGALGALGCVLLIGPAGGGAWLGYVLAFGAGLTWALYSVLARRMAGVPTEALAGFCAAVAVLCWVLHLLVEPPAAPGPRALVAAGLMGLGPVGAAFFLWDRGMKQGDPRLLGTLAYATPVASTLLLVLGGFAPASSVLLMAAALVALGGLIAART
ncbi:MAG: EamA family transporter [Rhodospirillales bacterium]|nr:EamA family transporter [Rhodospirillales bacterium]